ncbi:YlmC/YmxH family sporulation protein [Virgibacillus byunsanensis]|uniref:YlmC/YmxH family sporulation protein n=1 Tax=Virgibacillus byunsanensis TaxID=570945 RepID=A0ABW3LKW3_9BACI
MILLSELQIKEVIVIEDGRRLGHIADLEIDENNGKILSLVLMLRDKKSGIFGKTGELIIDWDQIVTIGSDVILVNDNKKPLLYSNNHYME